MVCVTLTDFENALTTLKGDSETFDFFSVDGLELKIKFVGRRRVWQTLKGTSLHCGLLAFMFMS